MAAPLVRQKSRDHRNRKNPGSAEYFKKLRKATNAARPYQVFIQDSLGGRWERKG